MTHEHDGAAGYLNSLKERDESGIYNCTLVDDSQCANFVVVVSNVEMMQRIATAIPLRVSEGFGQRRGCGVLFLTRTGARQGDCRRFCVCKGSSDAMTRTCLFEEIFQSFGVFNDYKNSDYFSFNNRIEPKSITFYDKALLRALYDPDLTSGTPVYRVLNRLMENLGFTAFRQ